VAKTDCIFFVTIFVTLLTIKNRLEILHKMAMAHRRTAYTMVFFSWSEVVHRFINFYDCTEHLHKTSESFWAQRYVDKYY